MLESAATLGSVRAKSSGTGRVTGVAAEPAGAKGDCVCVCVLEVWGLVFGV